MAPARRLPACSSGSGTKEGRPMPNHLLAGELANSGKLPSGLLFALVPLLVLVVALDVYCLIDLARAKSVRNAPKIVWAIVILFISAPIGALIYLFVGRDRDSGTARREAGAGRQEAGAGRREAVVAPDATE